MTARRLLAIVLAAVAVGVLPSAAQAGGGAGSGPQRPHLQIQYNRRHRALLIYLVAPRNPTASYPNCSLELQHRVKGRWQPLADTGRYLDQGDPNICLVLLREPVARLRRLAGLHRLRLFAEVVTNSEAYQATGLVRELKLRELTYPHRFFRDRLSG